MLEFVKYEDEGQVAYVTLKSTLTGPGAIEELNSPSARTMATQVASKQGMSRATIEMNAAAYTPIPCGEDGAPLADPFSKTAKVAFYKVRIPVRSGIR